MIYVTRLNNEEFIINAELIEFIEKTPDTVISLTTGKKNSCKRNTGGDYTKSYRIQTKNFHNRKG